MKKIVLISVFLALFGLIVISQVENKENEAIKNKILLNPVTTLESLDVVYDEFFKESTKNTALSKDYQAIIEKFEQKSPIFLLNECSSKYCFLTRKNHPEFRESFENYVSMNVRQKIAQSAENSINCVSFGSGGLFQDLIIFTKILSESPTATLTIHLIDRFFNKTDQNLANFIKEKESDKREWLQAHIHWLIEDEKFETTKTKGRIAQFEKFLTKEFPMAAIQVYTHKNVDEYFNCVKKENMLHTDVIFAADVSGGLDDYEKLCIETMRHNLSSVNILLLHDDKQAWLHQFFIENAENRTKTTVKGNENLTVFYERIFIEDTKKI